MSLALHLENWENVASRMPEERRSATDILAVVIHVGSNRVTAGALLMALYSPRGISASQALRSRR